MRQSDRKNGTPSESRRPRLVKLWDDILFPKNFVVKTQWAHKKPTPFGNQL